MDAYREPKCRLVYTFIGAKNTVQPAVPIQPGFAQVAWTLQVQKEPYFAIKIILTSLKQSFFV